MQRMILPTSLMALLACTLLFIGYRQGQGQHVAGFKTGMKTMAQVMPMLFFAFIVIGVLPALVPKEVFGRWVGNESGIRGILAGTVAGGLTPGGPVIQSLIAAGLFRSGAAVGTVVAFLTAGVLWAVNLLPIEAAILGWRLTLIRVASTFFFPPIAGLIAHVLFGPGGK